MATTRLETLEQVTFALKKLTRVHGTAEVQEAVRYWLAYMDRDPAALNGDRA